jgi:sugar lactone lactonase YvrE
MTTPRASLLFALLAASCASTVPGVSVIELPEKYNTPDGMALDASGDIILSCPNFNDPKYPATILRLDAEERIHGVIELPLHPKTGRVGPLGVAVGDDGHLYVADNQSDFAETPSSRLLRVRMKDGWVEECEVLVTGFVQSNAVCCRGEYVYVTETKLRPDATPLVSGVYRFSLAELDGSAPIELQEGGADPHLITTVETFNPDWRVGANGMGFDAEGNLYYCNFGDAEILKVTFDADGSVASQTVFSKGQGMLSTDGIKFHPVTGDIFVADFVGNAVHRVDGRTGEVTTLLRNGETDGRDGELDRPSEVCLRGNLLYVANIDLPFGGNEYDAPHTITVIELDEVGEER